MTMSIDYCMGEVSSHAASPPVSDRDVLKNGP